MEKVALLEKSAASQCWQLPMKSLQDWPHSIDRLIGVSTAEGSYDGTAEGG